MSDDNGRLERLLGRATRNFWDEVGEKATPPLLPTEQNSVKGDSFDKRAWTYMEDQLPVLKDQVDDLGGDYPTSPVAYEDLFRILNQGDPRLMDGKAIEPLYRPQQAILAGMLEAPDLKTVRKQTRYDDYNTAIAMMTMKDRMRKAFEDLQDLLDALQAAQEALEQAIADAQEAAGSGDGEAQEGAADALEQAMKQYLQAQGMSEEQAEQIAQAAQQAVREAKRELDRQADAASAYGVEDGELQRMSFDERRALAEKLDGGKMAHLANLVGQFREYADAERRRKITSAPSEVYDVEVGNNLSMLTGTEQMNMAIPELEDVFWARFAKHQLLQKKVRGAQNAGRGPILVVCDESGSMGAALDEAGNTREAWSKAVALALADQAKRAKRDFTYIGFSSQGQVWETGAENGTLTLEQSVDFVSHFWGGGTSYERPLQRAMAIVREYAAKGMKRPDIVFITDDECYVDDAFVEKWKADCAEADVQCYGIRVGAHEGDDGWKSTMRSLCDRIINVHRLTAKAEDVKDLWRLI